MRPIPGTISGAPGCGLGESEGVVWSTCGQLDSLRCAQRTAGIVADIGDNRRQIGIRDAEPAGERRRILIDRQRRDEPALADVVGAAVRDRKSTRLNSSHQIISYAVFCLKKKKTTQ